MGGPESFWFGFSFGSKHLKSGWLKLSYQSITRNVVATSKILYEQRWHTAKILLLQGERYLEKLQVQ